MLVRFVGCCQPRSRCCLVHQRPALEFHSHSWCSPSLSCQLSGRPGSKRSQLWPSVRQLDSSPRWSGLCAARPPKALMPSPLTAVCHKLTRVCASIQTYSPLYKHCCVSPEVFFASKYTSNVMRAGQYASRLSARTGTMKSHIKHWI